VANRLRAAIQSGELRPGSRLIEAAIAERLEVSKSPVREAIRILAAEGIVLATRRRGAYVRGTTEKDAHEIRVLRETLEGLAVALAMEHLDPAWLSQLEEMAVNMRSSTDRLQLMEMHLAFHEELTTQSQNDRLSQILANLRVQTRTVFPFVELLSGGAQVEAREHEDIVTAIRTGDVDHVQAVIREHIGSTADQLEAIWRTPSRAASDAAQQGADE
jgi:DNA-binding GntR family transcriptional regulator